MLSAHEIPPTRPSCHRPDPARPCARLACRARRRAAAGLVQPNARSLEVDTLGEVGHEIDEFVQDMLKQGLATGTQRT